MAIGAALALSTVQPEEARASTPNVKEIKGADSVLIELLSTVANIRDVNAQELFRADPRTRVSTDRVAIQPAVQTSSSDRKLILVAGTLILGESNGCEVRFSQSPSYDYASTHPEAFHSTLSMRLEPENLGQNLSIISGKQKMNGYDDESERIDCAESGATTYCTYTQDGQTSPVDRNRVEVLFSAAQNLCHAFREVQGEPISGV